jgi:predicted SAM-dependent methyltransferase
MKKILNYGCGEFRFESTEEIEFVNVDIEESVKPDLISDIRLTPLPFDEDHFDEVRWIHSIEHVEEKNWPVFFLEFYRVLKPSGTLMLAFPDFETCANNYITNYKGARDFWKATLYGLQRYPSDYHVTPIMGKVLASVLREFGFNNVRWAPEPGQEFNTFMTCSKSIIPCLYEKAVLDEAFAK